MAVEKRKLYWWQWVALGMGAMVLLVALLAVGLRYWIISDGGRSFIVSQIDGRKVGPLGVIRVSGLRGDPLQAATLADIAFVDDNGVWMRARGAEIKWTPFRLVRGQLEIQSAHISQIEVLRRPQTTYESSGQPAPNIGIKLEDIVIDELKIAGGVFGTAASYRVAGAVSRGQDGAGAFQLGVGSLSGPGDQIDALAEWSPRGAVKGLMNAQGPANGVLAGLLQAPADTVVALQGQIEGEIDAFEASVRVSIGEVDKLTFAASRSNASAEFDLKIDGADWPLLDPVVSRTGSVLTLAGRSDLTTLSAAPTRLMLNADAGQIEASALVNFDSMEIPETLALAATNLDLSRFAANLEGKLNATGQASFANLLEWSWTGDAAVVDFAVPGVAAKGVSGPVTASGRGATIAWRADELTAQAARVTSLERLDPADYTLAVRGSVNLATQQVEISQSQIRGAAGDATARGSYEIASGGFDFSGAASIARLQEFAPVSGAARGQWRVRRANPSAPMRLSIDMSGRNTSSANAALDDLLGASPRVSLEGVIHRGRTLVESGEIETAALTASMVGRVEENGAITGRAQGRLIRPVQLSGVRVDTLSFIANLSGATSEPRISLAISNGAVALPGLPLSDLSGTATLRLGDTPVGQFVLMGSTDDQPVRATGRLAQRGGDFALLDLNVVLGGLTARTPQLAFADGGVRSTINITGDLTGLAGISSGTVEARGVLATGDGLVFDLDGRITRLRRGVLAVDLLAFEGEADGDSAKLSGRIDGNFGAPATLAYAISAQAGETGGWSGDLTLSGEFDEAPISTLAPVTWGWNDGAWNVAGGISAFGGRMQVEASQDSEAARSLLSVDGLQLRALTRFARVNPMQGRLSGRSEFLNPANASATASFNVAIADANPVGVTRDPVTFVLESRVRDGRLTATATGNGQGFSLSADASASITEGEGFAVMLNTNAPVAATLRAEGRADQLWTIFGPEGQTLRGRIDADVRLAGLIADPDLSGGFALSEGVFEHAETGLRLTRIAARGQLQQSSLNLTQFSAADSNGGTLTATGELDWSGGLGGGIQFVAQNLRALGRDDRFAVVSGTGAVSLNPDAVLVEGDFDVQQARFSIEQAAAASIPVLPGLRRVGFTSAEPADEPEEESQRFRPVRLALEVSADRRIFVTGRGVDSEWSADFTVGGTANSPRIEGQATLVRGALDLAGRRFDLDTGAIRLSGPINSARVDISATRDADDIDATVRVAGTPDDLEFTLSSTPSLPQDEVLSRVLFGRSAAQLSALEAAQLAAGLTQLAGGQAAFDPAGLIRDATGLDRVSIGANEDGATVAAGKYLAEDVYVQLGAGGQGGVGAEIEWEPIDNVSIISSAQGNGDTRIAVRWKNDY